MILQAGYGDDAHGNGVSNGLYENVTVTQTSKSNFKHHTRELTRIPMLTSAILIKSRHTVEQVEAGGVNKGR